MEGVHHTEPPESATSVSVVSRDSVCVELILEALNGIDVLNIDIQGKYLNVPCQENV